LYEAKKYKKAIECYNKSLKIVPDLQQTWLDKGKALLKLKKYSDAILCFDKVQELYQLQGIPYYKSEAKRLKEEAINKVG